MAYCGNCGRQIDANAVFCVNCGARNNAAPAAQTAPPSYAPPVGYAPIAVKQNKPVTNGAKPKGKGALIAVITVISVVTVILIGAGAVAAYGFINGFDSLPVIGRFFEGDNSYVAEKDEDEDAPARKSKSSKTNKDSGKETEKTDANTEQAEQAGQAEKADGNAPAAAPPKTATVEATKTPSAVTIDATSALTGFGADNLLDGRTDTGWAVKQDSSGYHGGFIITLPAETAVYGIYIKNGCWSRPEDLAKYSRAKSLAVASGGFADSAAIYSASDPAAADYGSLVASRGEFIPFAAPVLTSSLTVSVIEIYTGQSDVMYITGIEPAYEPDSSVAAIGSSSPADPVTPVITGSDKQEYVDSLKAAYDAERVLDAASSSQAAAAAKAANSAWEYEINKIYGLLREKLPSPEFEILKKSELGWIKYKDALIDLAGSAYSAGEARDAARDKKSMEIQKLRCIELINYYFDGVVPDDYTEGSGTAAGNGVMAGEAVINVNNDGYVLPYSNVKALTDADLRGLSKDELRIARNEIYARYGRLFADEGLQQYFNSMPWYAALPKLPKGTDPTLSQLELSNIDLIKAYEAR